MVAKVYIPTLFPLTFLIALLALWIDQRLGFAPITESGLNFWLAGVTFIVGVVSWLATYEQLFQMARVLSISYGRKNDEAGHNWDLRLQP